MRNGHRDGRTEYRRSASNGVEEFVAQNGLKFEKMSGFCSGNKIWKECEYVLKYADCLILISRLGIGVLYVFAFQFPESFVIFLTFLSLGDMFSKTFAFAMQKINRCIEFLQVDN
jgi:hypothetical protein